MSDGPVLEVTDLRKSFGGITAVDGATFDIERGAVTGLIGPNGAGKTTTFNLISGFYTPDGGEIQYEGRDLQDIMAPSGDEQAIWVTSAALGVGGGLYALGGEGGILAHLVDLLNPLADAAGPPTLGVSPTVLGLAGLVAGPAAYYGLEYAKSESSDAPRSRPFQVSRAGLSRTFQITRELQNMTVLENLMLAPQDQSGESLWHAWLDRGTVAREESSIRDRAGEMLDLLELEHLSDELAGNLSGGQRKLLELGRVLMTDPELILLDEPVAGVNPTLTQNLLERIETLRDEGYTFCVVEHDMEVIMNLSDTVIVMDQGQVLMEGTPGEVRADERVVDAYLGG